MTYKNTEQLIQRYLNGETTAEEERLLAFEVSREDVPDDWRIIAGMLGELTTDEALFDQMMAERRQKLRIIRLWPWLAAACVAALLIVFLGPPKEDVSSRPQTKPVAEVNTATPHSITPEIVGPKVDEPQATVDKPLRHRTGRSSRSVPKETPKEITAPENGIRELTKVEASDIAPYEDPQMQFAEQARTIRERGNRVIQRVSMNSLPQNNNPLNDI
ncbi:MAG: hypothetical protein J6I52_02050 [Prevotella sp.]|nr:hypothetical protein [Prevotella sp.]